MTVGVVLKIQPSLRDFSRVGDSEPGIPLRSMPGYFHSCLRHLVMWDIQFLENRETAENQKGALASALFHRRRVSYWFTGILMIFFWMA